MSISTGQYLNGVCAVILEQGVGRARTQILSKQLKAKGGRVLTSVSDGSATHILVGNKVRRSRLPVLLGVAEVPSGVRAVRADWLSSCLTRGERVREEEYDVPLESAITSPSSAVKRRSLETSRPGGSGRTQDGVFPKNEEAESTAGEQRQSETSAGGWGKSGKEKEKDKSGGEREQCVAERYPTASRRWLTSSGRKKGKKRVSPDTDSDYTDSGGEEGEGKMADVDTSAVPPLAKRKRRWICEIPRSEVQSWVNHNKHITDKLEELLRVYQSSAEDKWRAFSTTKVIQAIKKHPKEITTYEEAHSLPFVGKRLAQKIEEIITSGDLRRLQAVDKEKQAILTSFTNIHGVGQVVAEQFYAQGFHSVAELAASGVLNRQQRIGVKHYDDFLERMPRDEVNLIEQRGLRYVILAVSDGVVMVCAAKLGRGVVFCTSGHAQVRELAHMINPGLEVITCGSYRRGKPTCGDVDILVTHGDGRSHRGVLPRLVQEGKESGFLTDDLSIHNDHNGGGKYLGVCRLAGEDRKYRRIDIYVTPYSEFPCTLLHFTGSGHFNRSMRSKADKLGMSLSEHSLNTGVIRQHGVKIYEGTPLPVFSERDVFNYLDIPYKEPTDRDLD